MKKSPLISIITINYNNSGGLRKTIESVMAQTFKDVEYIIIDGGSNDNSRDVIHEYSNEIAYWVSEPDSGIYHAMNKGIVKASGEYLLFLNSGDWLVDETILETVFKVPRAADILYGNLNEVQANGEIRVQVPLTVDRLTMANFYADTHPTIQHPASFIRRTLFENGLYDERYKIIADIKFFIEQVIIKNCSVEYLPFVITNFNVDGVSSNPSNWATTREERTRIFKELLPPRIFKDYEIFFQVKDSSLLPYIPFLEKTSGLKKLVTGLVGSIVKSYKVFKRID